MINRYPGKCECGEFVQAGQGVAIRADGRWIVQCKRCEAAPFVPQREMVGAVYWPNGEGYTECSAEYEEAIDEKLEATARLDELGGFGASYERNLPEGYAAAYEAFCRADAKVMTLLGEGGHLGERIHFDAPDPIMALIGGGKIAISPGGAARIVEA